MVNISVRGDPSYEYSWETDISNKTQSARLGVALGAAVVGEEEQK